MRRSIVIIVALLYVFALNTVYPEFLAASSLGVETAVAQGVAQCSDGIDNDGDGGIDALVEAGVSGNLESFFTYSNNSSFNLSLNQILGQNHDLANVNFKTTPFKLVIDERMLSRINYGKAGYTNADVSRSFDKDTYAQINGIPRSVAEEDPSCYVGPNVSNVVFGLGRIDSTTFNSVGSFLDLSATSGNTYIYSDGQRERWATPQQNCYPTIHSSRNKSHGGPIQFRVAAQTGAPNFSAWPFAYDGYFNTYGHGLYSYVTSAGELRFQYVTQDANSRVALSVGILVEAQCSDGSDNDGDGQTDFPNDLGCVSAGDTSEVMHDTGCSSPSDTTETDPAGPQCNNGTDDDGDGLIDFGQMTIQHQGAIDPTTEGWTDNPNNPGVLVGPVFNDQGFDAWKVEDNTTNAQRYYSFRHSTVERAQMMSNGWTYRERTRVVDTLTNPSGNDAVRMRVSTDNKHFSMNLGKDSNGDPLLHLRTNNSPFTGIDLTLSGLGSGYHLYEMVYDPVAQNVDVYVDSVLRQSNWSGLPLSQVPSWSQGELEWGSNASSLTGHGNYNLVEFEIGDPDCSSPQGNSEAGTQCSDGSDNDGDGATDFPDDFSCVDALDNNEASPQAECQDGLDNDSDGRTDFPSDFSCNSRQDDDETLPFAECQDGLDNDLDGVTDFPNDFSCIDLNDTSETFVQAECQDGLDNDNDGAIDFPADFSCTSNQINDEGGSLAECQDGLDNDNDGFTDFPNDFSCTSNQINDEGGSLAECQDGLDNDTDGFTDFPFDPGCATNQDDNETDPVITPQCSDGTDNDSDLLIDFPFDPGCSSAADNDETDPPTASECSDSVDNDLDSFTDFPFDPGCTFASDNSEIDPPIAPQCANSIDDDTDSFTDFPFDPGCYAAGDDDETDIVPAPECGDGTDNDNDSFIDYPFDPGCISAGDNDETDPLIAPQCANGLDDDTDNFIDFPLDIGCTSASDDDETDPVSLQECQDGLDNDLDSLIDFPLDPGCFGPTDNSELNIPIAPQCADGLDNDIDSFIDYPFDPGCASASDNDEVDPPTAPQCSNNADDDIDSLIDFPFDPGCYAASDNDETDPPIVPLCANGLDDDIDSLIDFPFDPGCYAAGDNDETDIVPAPECSDTVDNDSDGATDFPFDPGCVSAGDNDETDLVTAPQCSDILDNDTDGLTDFPFDPGCYAAGDDDETDLVVTTQCSDGIDNDIDSLIDFPFDPGCDSRQDDDETDPVIASQCSDGSDNDIDSLIDFPLDPGCVSASDNDETDPVTTPQCADIADNDLDLITDFPLDPGCYSASDNDERDLATAPQCNDGTDNDLDSFIDFPFDPGCISAGDNDETDPLVAPLCSNGLDDDTDFIIDFPLDPGCVSAADNDETDPVSPQECQDGLDNDTDSLTDFPFDPGCTGPTDNDETDPPTAPLCANGLDDDIDSLIDFPFDPGCASASDNDETDSPTAPLCANTIDDDTDSLIDFPFDPGCYAASDNSEIDPPIAPLCFNNIDDDTDSLTDFPFDPGCVSASDNDETDPVVAPLCANSIDDDFDSITDFPFDPGCYAAGDNDETDIVPAPLCSDGIDNDSDSFTDFPFDPGCVSAGDNDETDPVVAPLCANGLDDDIDSIIDFPFDPGCVSAGDNDETDPVVAPLCANSIDDDFDSITDFPFDPGCYAASDEDETDPVIAPLCANSLDDDADSLTDFPSDPGCYAASDNDEVNPLVASQCSDGLDNDTDSLIDYPWDPGCVSASDNDETDPVITPLCSDGLDNDSDSLIDFPFDPGCISAADNDETDTLPIPQCSDLSDNDSDTLIDFLSDPGCLFASDDDETDSLCFGSGGLMIDSSLVSRWSGDGQANDEKDGNDGVLVGDTTFAIGKVSSAFSLDGFGDFVTVPDAANLRLGSNQTVDAWIYPTANTGTWARIMGKGINSYRNYGLWRNADESLLFQFSNSGSTYCMPGGGTAPLNTWTHVAGTYDGITARLYVNGAEVANTPCTITPVTTSEPLDIGAINGNYFFEGRIDEVEVFNQTLQASDILAIFQADSAPRACNAQCFDTFDNDLDSLIDFPLDPGCTGPTDNDETDPVIVPLCADGLDNDTDSFIDYPFDPGCSSASDDDETDPVTAPECANSADDDLDSLTDFPFDPGCYAASDNTEIDPPAPPQCSDTTDNDTDGFTDFPFDPGCYAAGDNDETDIVPAPACSDAADNDTDSLIDFPFDPGCISAGDNDETDPLVPSLCFNSIDDDLDSITDFPLDPGCLSAADNDETDPVTAPECANSIDDDTDTFTDYPFDPGCYAAGDLDETDPLVAPVCFNGLDDEGDGWTDFPNDPGCIAASDTSELDPMITPFCYDTIDNDLDSLIDYPLDPGCISRADTDESDTFQCNDTADNDLDGATDFPFDFGCNSFGDDDEGNVLAECQDTIDNDTDLATDFPADAECGNNQDNGELFLSECSDGADNDGDGLIDFPQDPGCVTVADTNEFNTYQCNDGVDNEGDGAIDFPADFSCDSATDPSEILPAPGCDDGFDNDGDGDIDFPADFDCSSNQDNSESAITFLSSPVPSVAYKSNTSFGQTLLSGVKNFISVDSVIAQGPAQCDDALDNDLDGLTDFPLDPGCTSIADDDEFNTFECNDGIDNDGDGAIDFLADFSCSGPFDDAEGDPLAQCEDGLDNDLDGATDFPTDLGCVSNQDNDEQDVDLQMVKTGSSTVLSGTTLITYDLTLSNISAVTATGVTMTDVVPAGLTFNSTGSSAGCSLSGSTVICGVGTIANGASTGRILSFYLGTFSCGAVISNTASGSSFQTDSDLSNNQSTHNTTVACSTDLEIVKTGPGTVNRALTSVYTLTVNNIGSATGTNIVATDPVLSGLFFNAGQSSSSCVLNGGNVLCSQSGFTLAPGASTGFTVAFDVPAGTTCNSTINNSASITSDTPDSNAGNDSDSALTTVVCNDTDLTISKSGTGTVEPGQTLVYTLTGSNLGPGTGNSIIISDPIPAGLIFNAGLSSSNCTENVGNILCNSANLNPGASTGFTIAFDVPSSAMCGSIISNTGNITSLDLDLNLGNNSSSVNTTVTCIADVTVSKSGPASVFSGSTIIYTLTGSNLGSATGSNVVITDPIPAAGLVFNPGSSSAGCTQSGTDIVCTAAGFDLAPSASTGFSIAFDVTGAACNSTINNTATIATSTLESNTGNNTSGTVNTTVICNNPDLVLVKTGSASIITGTTLLTYGVSVTNTGFGTGTNVKVIDTIPTGLSFNAGNSSPGCALSGASLVECTVGTLGSSASTGRTIAFDVVTVGCNNVITNTALATSAESDINVLDNSGSVLTTMLCTADPSITKTGPTTVNRALTAVYTLTVTNNGASVGTGIVITDPVPSGLIFNSVVSSPDCSLSGSTVVCTPSGFTLGPLASTGRTVAFDAPAGATCDAVVTNTGSITHGSDDANPSNNSDAINTTIVCNDADLSISKSGTGTVEPGQTLIYTLTGSNIGPGTGSSIAITDAIPAGLTFNAGLSSTNCNENAGNILCGSFNLDPGTSTGVTIAFDVPSSAACGSVINNSATISGLELDLIVANNISSTVNTTVTCVADVTISKTGPATVQSGSTIAYTLTGSNIGSATGSNIVITDPIPTGLTFNPAFSSANCSQSGTDVLCTASGLTLLPSASTGFTVAFDVLTATCGSTISNTATISTTTLENNTANNTSSTVNTTVLCDTDLSVTKTGPATIASGTTISYTLTGSNIGSATGSNIVITDPIPTGLVFNPASSSANCSLSGTDVLCTQTGFILAPSASLGFTVAFDVLTATCGSTISNTASINGLEPDSNGANDSDTALTTVTCAADLAITKTGVATIASGATVSYTLNATNNGPGTGTSIIVTDPIPTGLTFNPASSSANCVQSGTDVLCTQSGFTLAPSAATGFTVAFDVVSAACASTINNTASIAGAGTDPNGANDSDTVLTSVTCAADLAITKTGPASIASGATVSYTLNATNNGPATGNTIIVTDPIPTGLTFNPASSSANCVQSGTDVLCTQSGFTLNPGASTGFTVAFDVLTAACSSTINNTASISGAEADSNAANDSDTALTTVTCNADLQLTKTGPASASTGTTVSYTLNATNNGPGDATSVIVTDPIPVGMAFNPASSSANCVQSGSDVLCTQSGFTLTNGSSTGFTLAFDLQPILSCNDTITNTGSIAGSQNDPNAGNNSDSQDTQVTCPTLIDIAVTKTGSASILSGTTLLTYDLTLTNSGSNTATGITITDAIPAGLTFNPALSSSNCVQSGNDVLCTQSGFTLAPLAATGFTIAFDVGVFSCGANIQNTATGSAFQTDTDLSDNQSTVNTTVTCVSGPPDLSLIKTGSASILTGATLMTYDLTVMNNGFGTGTNVKIIDTIPTGLSFNGAGSSAGCSLSGATLVECLVGTLSPSASSGRTIAFDIISAPCSSIITNVATSTSAEADGNAGDNGATSFTTVICPAVTDADLALTKSGPASVLSGATINYTLTGSNIGPGTGTNVRIVDSIPAGFSFNPGASSPTCSLSGSTVECTVGTLNPSASTGRTVSFDVLTATCNANAINTALIEGSEVDPLATNNTGSVVTLVQCATDLSLTKTGPATVNRALTATYTLTATNNGSQTGSNVVITDPIPSGLTYNIGSSSAACSQSGTDILCDGFSLAGGASSGFTVAFDVPIGTTCGSVINNTASVSSDTPDSNSGNDSDNALTTVVCNDTDLAISKSGPTTVVPGQTISYTLTGSNLGPGTGNSVTIIDPIPTGFGLTFNAGLSSAVCSQAGANIICSGFNLNPNTASGLTLVFDVPLTATCSGIINNTASITSLDLDLIIGNNTSSTVNTTVTCLADVTVSKSGAASVQSGSLLTYTLTGSNLGTATGNNVIISDPIPAGLTFNPASSSSSCVQSGSDVVCSQSGFTLAPQSSTGFAIAFDVLTAACSSTINNTATITTSSTESNAGNNTSGTVNTTVLCQPDLTVSKSGPASVLSGSTISYTLTGSNIGFGTGQNVTITDAIPAGLVFNAGLSSGACSQVVSDIVCSGFDLAPLASTGFAVTFDVLTAVCSSTINNSATISTTSSEGNLANNTSNTVNTTVVCSTDLEIVKTGPATVNRALSASYTLTANNLGSSTGTTVIVTDPIPSGLTFNGGSSSSSCVQSGSDIVCSQSGFTLNPGASTGFTVVFDVPIGATCNSTINNTANISSATPDSNAANDNDSFNTTIICDDADLTISKTGTGFVEAGQTIVYTLTGSNLGPGTGLSITVTDQIPSGLTFNAGLSNSNCSQIGMNVLCNLSNLDPSTSTGFAIAFNVPQSATCGSTIQNNASITGLQLDLNTGNNISSTVNTTVTCTADVTVSKSGPASVQSGATLMYTLTGSNLGAGTGSAITITDAIPAGLVFNAGLSSGVCSQVVSDIVCSGFSLSPFSVSGFTVAFDVTGAACSSTINNTATIATSSSESNTGNNTSGTVNTTVLCNADLAITKTGPATIASGATVSYTLNATNNGPATGNMIIVTDPIPAGLTFNPVSSSANCVQSGTDVLCTQSGFTLAPSAATGFTVAFDVLTATCGSTITNTANITGAVTDSNGANDSDTVLTTVTCNTDLAITKTGPATIASGATVSYTLNATNNGPGTGTSIIITDPIPAGLIFNTVTSSSGCVQSGSDVVCTQSGFTLANGSSSGFTVAFDVVSAACASTINNTASIAGAGTDPNGANDSDTALTAVTCAADLAITKTGPATIASGATVSYTLNATNNGPATGNTIIVTDPIPTGLTFNPASSSANCVQSGTDVLCTQSGFTLNPSAATGFTVAFDVLSATCGSTINNTASISGAEVDNNAANDSDTALTTVTCNTDLAITKTGPATIASGATVSYTLNATNNGPGTGTSIIVTDPIPTGLTYNPVSSSSNCVQSGTDVLCTQSGFTLANGFSSGFTVAFDVVSATCGSIITNTANIAGAGTDPNGANDSDTVLTSVTCAADLAITKTGPATIASGATVSYTLNATNNGPGTGTSIIVTDPIPVGLSFNIATSSTSCVQSGSDIVCSQSGFTLAPLAATGFTVAFDVQTATCGSTINNTASISGAEADNNAANDSDTALTTVICDTDLAITKTGPATIASGATVSYTLNATNNGPATGNMIIVTDPIPTGLTFNPVSSSSNCVQSGTDVLCTQSGFTLANGSSSGFTVAFDVVSATCGSTITNTVTIAGAGTDPNGANDSDSALTSVTCAADLAITKTGPASANSGTTVSYTLNATNNGPGTGTSIIVTDPIPSGLTYNPASSSTSCVQSGSDVVCSQSGFTLSPLAATGFTVAFDLLPTIGCGNMVTNTASISGAEADNNAANDSDSAMTTVVCDTDLAITKTGAATIASGATVSYTLTATNNGPGTGMTVIVTDPIPAGLSFNAGTSSTACVQSGSDVVCSQSGFTLSPLAATGFTVAFDVLSATCGSTINNTATISSAGVDTNGANDSDTALTTVTCAADLAITKTGPSSASTGSTVSYTLNATNNGPGTGTNIIVTDPIPAGVTFNAGTSSSNCVQSGSDVVCTQSGFTLTSGSSTGFTVAFDLLPTIGCNNMVTNTASISGAEADNNAANDSDSVITTVICPVEVDLAITKTGPASANTGSIVSYTLTATNNGPGTGANIIITDPIPAGLSFNNGSSSSGCVQSGSDVVCTQSGFTLNPLAATGFTVAFDLLPTIGCNNVVTNTAIISGSGSDTNAANDSDSVMTTVTCLASADVSLTKTGVASANTGTTVSYTLTVMNNGPDTATGIIVTDTVPNGMAYNPGVSSSGCVQSGSDVVCTQSGFTLTNGSSTGFTVAFDLQPTLNCNDIITNSGTVALFQTDPTPANNTDTQDTQVLCPVASDADLSITKTGVASANTGTTIAYTLTATNNGPANATGVIVTDPIQNGMAFNPASSSSNCVQSGTDVLCTQSGFTLAALASTGFTVAFDLLPTLNCDDIITNTGSIAGFQNDPTAANNADSQATQVLCPVATDADLAITKTGVASANTGSTVSYTLTATNNGPATGNSIIVTDPIPVGYSFNPASSSSNCVQSGTDVLCTQSGFTLNPLAATGFTVAFDLLPTIGCGNMVTNTASISGTETDSNATNDSDSVMTTVLCPVATDADLSITKSGAASVFSGSTIVYTLTGSNAGAASGNNILITDPVPTGLSYNAGSSSANCTLSGSDVVCGGSGFTLLSGSSTGFTVAFDVLTAVCSSTISNTATISGTENDPNSADNSATAMTTVDCISSTDSDVSITKSGPITAFSGGLLIYTLTGSNIGPGTGTSITITDPIPNMSALTFSGALSSGVCSEVGSDIICTGFDINPGTSTGLTIVFEVNNQACNVTVDNTATITSTSTDPDSSNNTSSTVQTTLICAGPTDAELSVTKSGPGSVEHGMTVTYQIDVTNNGQATANNVVVIETVPANTIFNNGAGCSMSGSDVACVVSSLTMGSTSSFTLEFDVSSSASCGSILSDTATVSADENDPYTTNNSSTVNTTVTCSSDVDLSISKSGPSTVNQGDSIIYTITVTNAGPATSNGAVVTDTIPVTGATFETSLSSPGCIQNGPDIECTLGSIASGGQEVIQISFISSNVTCGDTAMNTASVSALPLIDSDGSNNTTNTVVTDIDCPPPTPTTTTTTSGGGGGGGGGGNNGAYRGHRVNEELAYLSFLSSGRNPDPNLPGEIVITGGKVDEYDFSNAEFRGICRIQRENQGVSDSVLERLAIRLAVLWSKVDIDELFRALKDQELCAEWRAMQAAAAGTPVTGFIQTPLPPFITPAPVPASSSRSSTPAPVSTSSSAPVTTVIREVVTVPEVAFQIPSIEEQIDILCRVRERLERRGEITEAAIALAVASLSERWEVDDQVLIEFLKDPTLCGELEDEEELQSDGEQEDNNQSNVLPDQGRGIWYAFLLLLALLLALVVFMILTKKSTEGVRR